MGSNEARKRVRNPLDDAPALCRLSAGFFTADFADGSLSPVEAARAALERAEDLNPRYRAFNRIDHEGALAAARASRHLD
jgi:amidase/aspartyl-tRNA(Asn)/glutamyl-tRNA(Gln) amidotransferase subunit A